MSEQQGTFEGWAIVEVLGHRRFAGHVRQVLMGTAALLRVDVPAVELELGRWEGEDYVTRAMPVPEWQTFINPASLYQLTPCTEEHARSQAVALQHTPPGFVLPRKALPGGEGNDDLSF